MNGRRASPALCPRIYSSTMSTFPSIRFSYRSSCMYLKSLTTAESRPRQPLAVTQSAYSHPTSSRCFQSQLTATATAEVQHRFTFVSSTCGHRASSPRHHRLPVRKVIGMAQSESKAAASAAASAELHPPEHPCCFEEIKSDGTSDFTPEANR